MQELAYHSLWPFFFVSQSICLSCLSIVAASFCDGSLQTLRSMRPFCIWGVQYFRSLSQS